LRWEKRGQKNEAETEEKERQSTKRKGKTRQYGKKKVGESTPKLLFEHGNE